MKARILFLLTLALLAVTDRLHAQGTAFTYQGRFNVGTNPAGGTYNFQFSVYNASSGGSQFGGTVTNSGVGVTNGLFTTLVDFGPGVFTGAANWLQIGVETNGSNAFTILTPRQQLTPTPYAIYAEGASNLFGSLPASQLPATVVTNNETAVTLSNVTVSGNLNLPAPATIYSGGTNLLYADGIGDFYVGLNAGNMTTTGEGENTATGDGALIRNTTGYANTANGYKALYNNTTGAGNIANGFLALYNNTTGGGNTAIGASALVSNTFGLDNTAVGGGTLYSSTIASNNTAVGSQALFDNTIGSDNTAVGGQALTDNMDGGNNTAIGYQALYNNESGSVNTAIGYESLSNNSSGIENTAIGAYALMNSSNDNQLVAIGYQALQNDNAYANGLTTTGYGQNTAIGFQALQLDAIGAGNTAIGFQTLQSNTTGIFNTATGVHALYSNANGSQNTANGTAALYSNTTGTGNTAIGAEALYENTSGSSNTANGSVALKANTSGLDNTATGASALFVNTTGSSNTATGAGALQASTSGSYNTATGVLALAGLTSGIWNTADGQGALENVTDGQLNVALGYWAGYDILSGNDNIDICNVGQNYDNGITRIGTDGIQTSAYIAGVYNATASGGSPVYITSSGQLGLLTSSRRYKEHIQSMADASDVLLSLRPVTFRYKPDIDPKGIPQFGLVAEEVDQVDPDLVVHDDQHGIYTVRYEAVNAMLLNEFQKEHRQVEEQAAKVDALEKKLDELQAMVNRLSSQK